MKNFGRLFTFVLAIVVKTLGAQIPAAPSPEQPLTYRATSDFVLLDVSVKDTAGGHVPGLVRENFRVYEDGQLRAITHFSTEDVPVTIGLVIDTSGSMTSKYADVVMAARAFISASNRSDELFVVNFGDRVTSGLPDNIPFTDDPNKLKAALSRAAPAGRTALYDAILFSLNHLEKGTRDKKTLLLVSDGGDNNSTHGSEDVMRVVRESRATIYAIGIFDQDDKDQNPGLLRRLTRATGGEAFLQLPLSQIVTTCREIAADIRTRYTIGYAPIPSKAKGSLRKIRVVAYGPAGQKLTAHTRAGYYLPEASRYGEAARKLDR